MQGLVAPLCAAAGEDLDTDWRLARNGTRCATTGAHVHILLWWATVGVLYAAGMNLAARDWPTAYARWVVAMDVLASLCLGLLAAVASYRSLVDSQPRWGRGVLVCSGVCLGANDTTRPLASSRLASSQRVGPA